MDSGHFSVRPGTFRVRPGELRFLFGSAGYFSGEVRWISVTFRSGRVLLQAISVFPSFSQLAYEAALSFYVGVRGISKRSAAPNGISSGLTPTDVCVCAWGGWGSVHGGGWTPPHPAVVRRRGGRPGPKTALAPQLSPPKGHKKCEKVLQKDPKIEPK